MKSIAAIGWMDGYGLEMSNFSKILLREIYVPSQVAIFAGETWNANNAVGDKILPSKNANCRYPLAEDILEEFLIMKQKYLSRGETFSNNCLQAHQIP
ncbi:MAG: hypothetical protein ACP5OU_02530 [Methanothrix sp.]